MREPTVLEMTDMPNDEFDPEKMKACTVGTFLIAGLAVTIIYLPYWMGVAG